MAKINASPKTAEYRNLAASSKAKNENKDCAVIAIAAVTGHSYDQAHETLAKHGRNSGHGSYMHQILAAVKTLGFDVTLVHESQFISRYPKAHRTLKGVTTHHPERFNKVWADGHNYLLVTKGHIAGVVDGTNHDWTKGKAKRVTHVYRVAANAAKKEALASNAAYMKNTALEMSMIHNIVHSCYRSGYLVDNEPIWVFDVVDSPEDKGVIASLIKKGIVKIDRWDDDENVVYFTEHGLKIAQQMFPGE